MATRLLREMSRPHHIKDRTERALGVVKAFSIAVPSGMQLKLDVQAASSIADSGDHEQDLTDLLREIGEVAQTTGAGALFPDRREAQPPDARWSAHSGLPFGRQSRAAPA
jgi:hypothetical protein